MKKISILLTLLLLLPFLSAIEFNVNSEYSQGETLITKISGNFIEPPQKQNIILYNYEGAGRSRIPIEYDLQKISGEYYLYIKLPEQQNNYSIVIENVEYYSGSKVIDDDLVAEFATTNTTADFSVMPGFVSTDTDFSIEVQNLQDSSIKIISTFLGTSQNTTLLSGETEEIEFSTGDINETGMTTLEMKTDNLVYEIPVYVSEITKEDSEGERAFSFDSPQIEFSLATNSSATAIIYLENNGDEDLQNITLELSEEIEPYVSLSFDELEELDANKSKKLTLEISSDLDEASLNGSIKAKAEPPLYAYCSIELNFIKDYIPDEDEKEETGTDSGANESEEEELEEVSKTCAEAEGTFCTDNEECDAERVYASDGVCCLGSCEEIKKSAAGKLIGWLLILIVVSGVAWFFLKRYRRVR